MSVSPRERADKLRSWCETGIGECLEEDPSGFLLGIESTGALDLLPPGSVILAADEAELLHFHLSRYWPKGIRDEDGVWYEDHEREPTLALLSPDSFVGSKPNEGSE